MATVLLQNLKAHFKDVQIDVLVKSPFDLLLKNHPDIHQVIGFFPKKKLYQKILMDPICHLLKKERYDLGILCTNSISSLLIFKYAKVKKIIGFERGLFSFLMDHPLKKEKNLHQKNQYLCFLKPLGIDSSSNELNLHFFQENSKSCLAKLNILLDKPYVIFHPGASYGSAKSWPLDHFETLAKKVLEKTSLHIFYLGVDQTKKTSLSHPRFIDLSNQTSLEDLLCLIQSAKAIICNDSGPMHIADAFKVPLLAFFGPTDPKKTGPSSLSSHIIHNQTPCGPCFKRTCPLDHACMQNIHPDTAFSKLEQMGLYSWDT